MFTSLHPAECAIALDDRTLANVIRSEPTPEFRVFVAGEYFHRFNKVVPGFLDPAADLFHTHPPELVVPNEAHDRNFDFRWIRDTPKAYRCWMRARWKLYTPRWTNRTPPSWITDHTDNTLLCCHQRYQLGFISHHTHGKAQCIACGGTIKWRCKAHRNYVSFRCIDQPCLTWTEEKKS